MNYGWESTFGTASSTINKAFGHGVKVTNLRRGNNVEPVYSGGLRPAQKLPVLKYEGAISVEFVLANPWFLRAVQGAAPTDGGSAPYTHTFAQSTTVDSFTILNQINTDTKSVASLLGCKVNQCTISTAINQLATVKLDCLFINESHATGNISQVTDSFDLYHFVYGSLEVPDGTTLAMVQNVDFTIGNNAEPVYGIGSRFAANTPVKNKSHTVRANMNFSDYTKTLQQLWGATNAPQTAPAEVADLALNFDNGLTGSSMRKVVMTLTGIQLGEHNLPQDPTSVIFEDWSAPGRALSIVASDNTQTAV